MSFNKKMTAIADTIRGFTSKPNDHLLSLDAMASGVGEVYEAGKQSGGEKYYTENVKVPLSELRMAMRGTNDYGANSDFKDTSVQSHVDVVLADFKGVKDALIEAGAQSVPFDTSTYGDIISDVISDVITELGKKPPYYLQYEDSSYGFSYDMNSFGKTDVVITIPNVTRFPTFLLDNGTVNETVENLTINGICNGKILLAEYAFASRNIDNKLKTLTLNCDFSKCGAFASIFANRQALEEIITPENYPIDFSSAGSGGIGAIAPNCINLREIRFAKESIKTSINLSSCSKLSDESIQSFVDGLGDFSKYTTYDKIYLHSDVIDRLTSTQKSEIERKMWRYVL